MNYLGSKAATIIGDNLLKITGCVDNDSNSTKVINCHYDKNKECKKRRQSYTSAFFSPFLFFKITADEEQQQFFLDDKKPLLTHPLLLLISSSPLIVEHHLSLSSVSQGQQSKRRLFNFFIHNRRHNSLINANFGMQIRRAATADNDGDRYGVKGQQEKGKRDRNKKEQESYFHKDNNENEGYHNINRHTSEGKGGFPHEREASSSLLYRSHNIEYNLNTNSRRSPSNYYSGDKFNYKEYKKPSNPYNLSYKSDMNSNSDDCNNSFTEKTNAKGTEEKQSPSPSFSASESEKGRPTNNTVSSGGRSSSTPPFFEDSNGCIPFHPFGTSLSCVAFSCKNKLLTLRRRISGAVERKGDANRDKSDRSRDRFHDEHMLKKLKAEVENMYLYPPPQEVVPLVARHRTRYGCLPKEIKAVLYPSIHNSEAPTLSSSSSKAINREGMSSSFEEQGKSSFHMANKNNDQNVGTLSFQQQQKKQAITTSGIDNSSAALRDNIEGRKEESIDASRSEDDKPSDPIKIFDQRSRIHALFELLYRSRPTKQTVIVDVCKIYHTAITFDLVPQQMLSTTAGFLAFFDSKKSQNSLQYSLIQRVYDWLYEHSIIMILPLYAMIMRFDATKEKKISKEGLERINGEKYYQQLTPTRDSNVNHTFCDQQQLQQEEAEINPIIVNLIITNSIRTMFTNACAYRSLNAQGYKYSQRASMRPGSDIDGTIDLCSVENDLIAMPSSSINHCHHLTSPVENASNGIESLLVKHGYTLSLFELYPHLMGVLESIVLRLIALNNVFDSITAAISQPLFIDNNNNNNVTSLQAAKDHSLVSSVFLTNPMTIPHSNSIPAMTINPNAFPNPPALLTDQMQAQTTFNAFINTLFFSELESMGSILKILLPLFPVFRDITNYLGEKMMMEAEMSDLELEVAKQAFNYTGVLRYQEKGLDLTDEGEIMISNVKEKGSFFSANSPPMENFLSNEDSVKKESGNLAEIRSTKIAQKVATMKNLLDDVFPLLCVLISVKYSKVLLGYPQSIVLNEAQALRQRLYMGATDVVCTSGQLEQQRISHTMLSSSVSAFTTLTTNNNVIRTTIMPSSLSAVELTEFLTKTLSQYTTQLMREGCHIPISDIKQQLRCIKEDEDILPTRVRATGCDILMNIINTLAEYARFFAPTIGEEKKIDLWKGKKSHISQIITNTSWNPGTSSSAGDKRGDSTSLKFYDNDCSTRTSLSYHQDQRDFRFNPIPFDSLLAQMLSITMTDIANGLIGNANLLSLPSSSSFATSVMTSQIFPIVEGGATSLFSSSKFSPSLSSFPVQTAAASTNVTPSHGLAMPTTAPSVMISTSVEDAAAAVQCSKGLRKVSSFILDTVFKTRNFFTRAERLNKSLWDMTWYRGTGEMIISNTTITNVMLNSALREKQERWGIVSSSQQGVSSPAAVLRMSLAILTENSIWLLVGYNSDDRHAKDAIVFKQNLNSALYLLIHLRKLLTTLSTSLRSNTREQLSSATFVNSGVGGLGIPAGTAATSLSITLDPMELIRALQFVRPRLFEILGVMDQQMIQQYLYNGLGDGAGSISKDEKIKENLFEEEVMDRNVYVATAINCSSRDEGEGDGQEGKVTERSMMNSSLTENPEGRNNENDTSFLFDRETSKQALFEQNKTDEIESRKYFSGRAAVVESILVNISLIATSFAKIQLYIQHHSTGCTVSPQASSSSLSRDTGILSSSPRLMRRQESSGSINPEIPRENDINDGSSSVHVSITPDVIRLLLTSYINIAEVIGEAIEKFNGEMPASEDEHNENNRAPVTGLRKIRTGSRGEKETDRYFNTQQGLKLGSAYRNSTIWAGAKVFFMAISSMIERCSGELILGIRTEQLVLAQQQSSLTTTTTNLLNISSRMKSMVISQQILEILAIFGYTKKVILSTVRSIKTQCDGDCTAKVLKDTDSASEEERLQACKKLQLQSPIMKLVQFYLRESTNSIISLPCQDSRFESKEGVGEKNSNKYSNNTSVEKHLTASTDSTIIADHNNVSEIYTNNDKNVCFVKNTPNVLNKFSTAALLELFLFTATRVFRLEMLSSALLDGYIRLQNSKEGLVNKIKTNDNGKVLQIYSSNNINNCNNNNVAATQRYFMLEFVNEEVTRLAQRYFWSDCLSRESSLTNGGNTNNNALIPVNSISTKTVMSLLPLIPFRILKAFVDAGAVPFTAVTNSDVNTLNQQQPSHRKSDGLLPFIYFHAHESTKKGVVVKEAAITSGNENSTETIKNISPLLQTEKNTQLTKKINDNSKNNHNKKINKSKKDTSPPTTDFVKESVSLNTLTATNNINSSFDYLLLSAKNDVTFLRLYLSCPFFSFSSLSTTDRKSDNATTEAADNRGKNYRPLSPTADASPEPATTVIAALVRLVTRSLPQLLLYLMGRGMMASIYESKMEENSNPTVGIEGGMQEFNCEMRDGSSSTSLSFSENRTLRPGDVLAVVRIINQVMSMSVIKKLLISDYHHSETAVETIVDNNSATEINANCNSQRRREQQLLEDLWARAISNEIVKQWKMTVSDAEISHVKSKKAPHKRTNKVTKMQLQTTLKSSQGTHIPNNVTNDSPCMKVLDHQHDLLRFLQQRHSHATDIRNSKKGKTSTKKISDRIKRTGIVKKTSDQSSSSISSRCQEREITRLTLMGIWDVCFTHVVAPLVTTGLAVPHQNSRETWGRKAVVSHVNADGVSFEEKEKIFVLLNLRRHAYDVDTCLVFFEKYLIAKVSIPKNMIIERVSVDNNEFFDSFLNEKGNKKNKKREKFGNKNRIFSYHNSNDSNQFLLPKEEVFRSDFMDDVIESFICQYLIPFIISNVSNVNVSMQRNMATSLNALFSTIMTGHYHQNQSIKYTKTISSLSSESSSIRENNESKDSGALFDKDVMNASNPFYYYQKYLKKCIDIYKLLYIHIVKTEDISKENDSDEENNDRKHQQDFVQKTSQRKKHLYQDGHTIHETNSINKNFNKAMKNNKQEEMKDRSTSLLGGMEYMISSICPQLTQELTCINWNVAHDIVCNKEFLASSSSPLSQSSTCSSLTPSSSALFPLKKISHDIKTNEKGPPNNSFKNLNSPRDALIHLKRVNRGELIKSLMSASQMLSSFSAFILLCRKCFNVILMPSRAAVTAEGTNNMGDNSPEVHAGCPGGTKNVDRELIGPHNEDNIDDVNEIIHTDEEEEAFISVANCNTAVYNDIIHVIKESMTSLCDFIVNALDELQTHRNANLSTDIHFRNVMTTSVVMPVLLSLSSVSLRHLGVLYALMPMITPLATVPQGMVQKGEIWLEVNETEQEERNGNELTEGEEEIDEDEDPVMDITEEKGDLTLNVDVINAKIKPFKKKTKLATEEGDEIKEEGLEHHHKHNNSSLLATSVKESTVVVGEGNSFSSLSQHPRAAVVVKVLSPTNISSIIRAYNTLHVWNNKMLSTLLVFLTEKFRRFDEESEGLYNTSVSSFKMKCKKDSKSNNGNHGSQDKIVSSLLTEQHILAASQLLLDLHKSHFFPPDTIVSEEELLKSTKKILSSEKEAVTLSAHQDNSSSNIYLFKNNINRDLILNCKDAHGNADDFDDLDDDELIGNMRVSLPATMAQAPAVSGPIDVLNYSHEDELFLVGSAYQRSPAQELVVTLCRYIYGQLHRQQQQQALFLIKETSEGVTASPSSITASFVTISEETLVRVSSRVLVTLAPLSSLPVPLLDVVVTQLWKFVNAQHNISQSSENHTRMENEDLKSILAISSGNVGVSFLSGSLARLSSTILLLLLGMTPRCSLETQRKLLLLKLSLPTHNNCYSLSFQLYAHVVYYLLSSNRGSPSLSIKQYIWLMRCVQPMLTTMGVSTTDVTTAPHDNGTNDIAGSVITMNNAGRNPFHVCTRATQGVLLGVEEQQAIGGILLKIVASLRSSHLDNLMLPQSRIGQDSTKSTKRKKSMSGQGQATIISSSSFPMQGAYIHPENLASLLLELFSLCHIFVFSKKEINNNKKKNNNILEPSQSQVHSHLAYDMNIEVIEKIFSFFEDIIHVYTPNLFVELSQDYHIIADPVPLSMMHGRGDFLRAVGRDNFSLSSQYAEGERVIDINTAVNSAFLNDNNEENSRGSYISDNNNNAIINYKRVWTTASLNTFSIALAKACRCILDISGVMSKTSEPTTTDNLEKKHHFLFLLSPMQQQVLSKRAAKLALLSKSVLIALAHRARNSRTASLGIAPGNNESNMISPDVAASWLYLHSLLNNGSFMKMMFPEWKEDGKNIHKNNKDFASPSSFMSSSAYNGSLVLGQQLFENNGSPEEAANVDAICSCVVKRPHLLSTVGAVKILEVAAVASHGLGNDNEKPAAIIAEGATNKHTQQLYINAPSATAAVTTLLDNTADINTEIETSNTSLSASVTPLPIGASLTRQMSTSSFSFSIPITYMLIRAITVAARKVISTQDTPLDPTLISDLLEGNFTGGGKGTVGWGVGNGEGGSGGALAAATIAATYRETMGVALAAAAVKDAVAKRTLWESPLMKSLKGVQLPMNYPELQMNVEEEVAISIKGQKGQFVSDKKESERIKTNSEEKPSKRLFSCSESIKGSIEKKNGSDSRKAPQKWVGVPKELQPLLIRKLQVWFDLSLRAQTIKKKAKEAQLLICEGKKWEGTNGQHHMEEKFTE